MKVKIGKEVKEYRAIWETKRGVIQAIDQRKLPFSFEIFESKTIDETCYAIKEMVVRGAPLIGVTAAYGMLQAANNYQGKDFQGFLKQLDSAANKLKQTRPTAVDLSNAIERMKTTLNHELSIEKNVDLLASEVKVLTEATIEECRAIGEWGNRLIPSGGCSIMTICNAGALATVDIGTATAPIRKANEGGKKITIYINETRPRVQGGRLTAWELYNEGIAHFVIADNAAGHLIKNGKIDLVIVGADRIALNGDTANKIGTYTLSVLCKENQVPFYVAAPKSTFDRQTKTGKEITIEERDSIEVKTVVSVESEKDRNPKRRIIHYPFSPNLNPAFDVTPAKNITGIITPERILKPPFDKSIKDFLELDK